MKLPNLHMLIKQSPSLPRNLALWTFGELLIIVFSAKVNLLYFPYSTTRRWCLLHLIKQNCFLKTFPKTLISMTQAALYPFVRLELKMHNISVIPKMVKKVITNLIDSSNVSGPDCISVVVLKNCEPEILYILAELFNMCLKESCFPDCWKVSSVVPVFKNVVAGSTA